MCAWRPKHNLQETVLSFSCMCSRNWTQFLRLTSTFITKPYCWPHSRFLLYSLSIEFSIFLLKTLIHSLLREFSDSVILLWQMIPYFNTLLLYRTALQIKQTPAVLHYKRSSCLGLLTVCVPSQKAREAPCVSTYSLPPVECNPSLTACGLRGTRVYRSED